jgi:tRNA nucleotidyltransferase (CCA-adding enzyme)
MPPIILLLPERIRLALERLTQAGFKAYVVGGCVRDALLGIEPNDWDITTSAPPTRIKEVFKEYRQIDAGLKHGTVMVRLDGETVEITTFRVDGQYSDGRRPDSVAFTSNLTEDLARRDFTINACAATENTLIDPFGGRLDAQNRLIRCVGEPQRRFEEDALRILRGIRFSAVLDFNVEDKTRQAMCACIKLLKNVSQERVTEEFCKTLLGKAVKKTLLEFRAFVACIVPEMAPTFGFEQYNPHHCYDVYTHIATAVGEAESDALVRTALFFHDIAKPQCFTLENGVGHFYGHTRISAELTEKTLKRMKFPASHIRDITELVCYHDSVVEPSERCVKRLLNKLGEVQTRRLLKVKRADILAQNPDYASRIQSLDAVTRTLEDILSRHDCVTLKELALDGNDLIEAGIEKGRPVGMMLKDLLGQVLDGRLENTKSALLQEVKKSMK